MARIWLVEDGGDVRQILDPTEADRVLRCKLYADDPPATPAAASELIRRIRTVLERLEEALPTSGHYAEFGALRIDRERHRVWVANRAIELTSLEFRLLVTLYECRNRVQSRSALLAHCWGAQTSVSARTVDAHVKRLREKLGEARAYVQTVRGVGYRFAEAAAQQAR